jgi:serine/threonine-protein kinase HipA
LIVKSGRAEYPHLALNEFICMTIAKTAGLVVPEFWLSANRELFVMRRFDSAPDGSRLGFEDFAALTSRQPERKYEGSYELIARMIRMFVAAHHTRAALDQLFDTVALSCAVGNGDAHLKNFGVLYTHPAVDDVRIAPVYDVVNTTLYLPHDSLALALGRNKSKAFAGRAGLLRFAATCEVADAEQRLDRIEAAMVQTMETYSDLIDEAEGFRGALETGLRRVERAGADLPAPGDG